MQVLEKYECSLEIMFVENQTMYWVPYQARLPFARPEKRKEFQEFKFFSIPWQLLIPNHHQNLTMTKYA